MGTRDAKNASFQVLILGSGGGPSEENVSGYLVRSLANDWQENSLLAVDAGVHLSGIIRILEEGSKPKSPTRGSKPKSPTTAPQKLSKSNPFYSCKHLPHATARANGNYILQKLVSTFLLTHSHLDHISGFVMNTAALMPSDRPKKVAGLAKTMDSLKTHIFNDVIWPNLSDEDGGVGLFSYERLSETDKGSNPLHVPVTESGLSVQSYAVSHGDCMKRVHPHHHTKTKCAVDSSAFFIKDDTTNKEFLIWGDVEPDTISSEPRNRAVWRACSHKITSNVLDTIFLECSYNTGRATHMLYGHLSPEHLIAELEVLAIHVAYNKNPQSRPLFGSPGGSPDRKRRDNTQHRAHVRAFQPPSPSPQPLDPDYGSVPTPQSMVDTPEELSGPEPPMGTPEVLPKDSLKNVRVVITHVKETFRDGEDTVGNIEESCRRLAVGRGLECEFIGARAGMEIYI